MLGISLLAYKAWPLFVITGVLNILQIGATILMSVVSGGINIILFTNVLACLKWIVLIALFVVSNTEFLPNLKKVAKVLCFIPILIEIISIVLQSVFYMSVMYGYTIGNLVITMVPRIVMIVLVSLAVVFTSRVPKQKVVVEPTGEPADTPTANIADAKVGMA